MTDQMQPGGKPENDDGTETGEAKADMKLRSGGPTALLLPPLIHTCKHSQFTDAPVPPRPKRQVPPPPLPVSGGSEAGYVHGSRISSGPSVR